MKIERFRICAILMHEMEQKKNICIMCADLLENVENMLEL